MQSTKNINKLQTEQLFQNIHIRKHTTPQIQTQKSLLKLVKRKKKQVNIESARFSDEIQKFKYLTCEKNNKHSKHQLNQICLDINWNSDLQLCPLCPLCVEEQVNKQNNNIVQSSTQVTYSDSFRNTKIQNAQKSYSFKENKQLDTEYIQNLKQFLKQIAQNLDERHIQIQQTQQEKYISQLELSLQGYENLTQLCSQISQQIKQQIQQIRDQNKQQKQDHLKIFKDIIESKSQEKLKKTLKKLDNIARLRKYGEYEINLSNEGYFQSQQEYIDQINNQYQILEGYIQQTLNISGQKLLAHEQYSMVQSNYANSLLINQNKNQFSNTQTISQNLPQTIYTSKCFQNTTPEAQLSFQIVDFVGTKPAHFYVGILEESHKDKSNFLEGVCLSTGEKTQGIICKDYSFQNYFQKGAIYNVLLDVKENKFQIIQENKKILFQLNHLKAPLQDLQWRITFSWEMKNELIIQILDCK